MSFWDTEWKGKTQFSLADVISHHMQTKSTNKSYYFLGDLRGKRLLEIGCGSGIQTVYFASKGALVTAIDVSKEGLNVTKERCVDKGFSNVKTFQADVQNLSKFKDETFDFVYINCVLMHVPNKKLAINECMRVLKKGGKFVVKENLKHWLFSFPYRTLSPFRKTKPSYVSYGFINKMGFKHREYYLFSTFFLFLFFLFKNKKTPISIINKFEVIDRFLIALFPFLRPFTWVTVGRIVKK